MNAIALDAGALIALERNERTLWTALKVAAERRADVLVPSTALAQVWRGTAAQARLSSALEHCVIAAFDPLARAVGALCGKTGTRDICDAHVALVAHGCDCLFTSDPRDLKRLLLACGKQIPQIVRC